VFVVASAREGFDPAAVLFEFDGVRRDTAPSRETGQAVASGARTGAAVSSHWDGDYPHPTLNQSAKGSGGVGSSNQEIFSQRGAYLAPQPVAARMVAFGEYVDDGTASAMKARDYKDATDLVAQPIAFSRNDDGRDATTDLSPTMRVAGRAGGMLGVAQPISIQDVRPVEKAQNGKGWNDDGTAYTVDTHATQGVAHPINIYGGNKRPDRPEGGFYVRTDEDTSKTLDAATGLNPTCSQGGTAVMQPMAFTTEQTPKFNDDCALTLTKQSPTGGGQVQSVMHAMQVRRLTPVECERLQGFPDNYTNIPWRKKDESPDGPRYKALGNSWAVPNVRWIGERIQNHISKKDAR
jgi:DNA (cytosine-5)-methyltransferase 1